MTCSPKYKKGGWTSDEGERWSSTLFSTAWSQEHRSKMTFCRVGYYYYFVVVANK